MGVDSLPYCVARSSEGTIVLIMHNKPLPVFLKETLSDACIISILKNDKNSNAFFLFSIQYNNSAKEEETKYDTMSVFYWCFNKTQQLPCLYTQ